MCPMGLWPHSIQPDHPLLQACCSASGAPQLLRMAISWDSLFSNTNSKPGLGTHQGVGMGKPSLGQQCKRNLGVYMLK